MRIEFEMSGGYGGLFATKPLSLDVDTGALSEEERGKLINLVNSSGVQDLEPQMLPPPAPSARDTFKYHLRITEAGENRSFAFDDSTVPASLRPLLDALRRRAIERRAGTD